LQQRLQVPQILSVIGASYQFPESRTRQRRAVFVGGKLSEHVGRAVDRSYANGHLRKHRSISHV
jgi:hypothetical protein